MNSRVGDEFQDGAGPRLSELIARWFEMYGKILHLWCRAQSQT